MRRSERERQRHTRGEHRPKRALEPHDARTRCAQRSCSERRGERVRDKERHCLRHDPGLPHRPGRLRKRREAGEARSEREPEEGRVVPATQPDGQRGDPDQQRQKAEDPERQDLQPQPPQLQLAQFAGLADHDPGHSLAIVRVSEHPKVDTVLARLEQRRRDRVQQRLLDQSRAGSGRAGGAPGEMAVGEERDMHGAVARQVNVEREPSRALDRKRNPVPGPALKSRPRAAPVVRQAHALPGCRVGRGDKTGVEHEVRLFEHLGRRALRYAFVALRDLRLRRKRAKQADQQAGSDTRDQSSLRRLASNTASVFELTASLR